MNIILRKGAFAPFFIAWAVCLAIPIISAAQSGRITKAFDAYNAYNYGLAKEFLNQRLDKEPFSAAYGLSVLHADKQSPFFQPDTALKYWDLALEHWQSQDAKSRQGLKEKLSIDSSAVARQTAIIDSLQFSLALADSGLTRLSNFVKNRSESPLAEQAREERNRRAFNRAISLGTSAALKAYLEHYPGAAQTTEARARYEELLYREQTAGGTVHEFEMFAKNYPQSPFRKEAEFQVYKLETESNLLTDYQNFIQRHPENSYVEQAWRRVYALEVPYFDPRLIAAFTIKYPAYPFAEELKKDFSYSVTEFYPIEISGKWGFIDERGSLRIDPQFEFVEEFSGGIAQVGLNGKEGFIDKRGNWIAEPQFDFTTSFKSGFALVEVNGLYGLLDRNGRYRIEPTYEELGEPYGDLLYALKNDLYGYLNTRGEIKIKFQFASASDFTSGTAVCEADSGGFGLIDTTGWWLVPPIFDWCETPQEALSRVRKGNGFGLFDLNLDSLILPTEYQLIAPFENGLALVAQGGQYGFVNRKGEFKIPMEYDFIPTAVERTAANNGSVRVHRKGKWGIVDSLNKKVFPVIFDDLAPLDSPLTAVSKQGKWGYANEAVKLQIPYKYSMAWNFTDSIARVRTSDNLMGLINRKGQWILEPRFEEILPLDTAHWLVRDSLYGLLDTAFQTLVPFTYQEAEQIRPHVVRFKSSISLDYYDLRTNRFIWREESAGE